MGLGLNRRRAKDEGSQCGCSTIFSFSCLDSCSNRLRTSHSSSFTLPKGTLTSDFPQGVSRPPAPDWDYIIGVSSSEAPTSWTEQLRVPPAFHSEDCHCGLSSF